MARPLTIRELRTIQKGDKILYRTGEGDYHTEAHAVVKGTTANGIQLEITKVTKPSDKDRLHPGLVRLAYDDELWVA